MKRLFKSFQNIGIRGFSICVLRLSSLCSGIQPACVNMSSLPGHRRTGNPHFCQTSAPAIVGYRLQSPSATLLSRVSGLGACFYFQPVTVTIRRPHYWARKHSDTVNIYLLLSDFSKQNKAESLTVNPASCYELLPFWYFFYHSVL